MSAAALDPWTDAAEIASRLALPSARLVVIVGAESWCETCRTVRPVFDTVAAQRADPAETWLWLDLEEHAEFLGDFIPDSLPFLLAYTGPQLTHAVLTGSASAAVLQAQLGHGLRIEHDAPPGLRERLMAPDWVL